MKRYKLCFYVPEIALDVVKQAIFSAGAGTVGNYSQCCWQTLGEGQFKPGNGAIPAIGEVNMLNTVSEYKVEVLCSEQAIHKAVKALKRAHPYEEPAYDVFELLNY